MREKQAWCLVSVRTWVGEARTYPPRGNVGGRRQDVPTLCYRFTVDLPRQQRQGVASSFTQPLILNGTLPIASQGAHVRRVACGTITPG